MDVRSGIVIDGLNVSDGREISQNDTTILFEISYDCGWVMERDAASHFGCRRVASGLSIMIARNNG